MNAVLEEIGTKVGQEMQDISQRMDFLHLLPTKAVPQSIIEAGEHDPPSKALANLLHKIICLEKKEWDPQWKIERNARYDSLREASFFFPILLCYIPPSFIVIHTLSPSEVSFVEITNLPSFLHLYCQLHGLSPASYFTMMKGFW